VTVPKIVPKVVDWARALFHPAAANNPMNVTMQTVRRCDMAKPPLNVQAFVVTWQYTSIDPEELSTKFVLDV
jgi:hypothetical protein